MIAFWFWLGVAFAVACVIAAVVGLILAAAASDLPEPGVWDDQDEHKDAA